MPIEAPHFLCFSAPRVQRTIEQLAQHGIDAVGLPFQQIHSTVVHAMAGQQFLRNVSDFDAVVFTSPNAVEALIPFQHELVDTLPTVSQPRIYAVGPGTAAVLAAHFAHLAVNQPLEQFDAAGVEQLILTTEAPGAKVAVVRGQVGRDDWIERLTQRGFGLQLFAVYEALDCSPSDESTALFVQATAAAGFKVVLSSVRNVEQFCRWAQTQGVAPQVLYSLTTVAIHPKIRRELDQRGFTHTQLIAPGLDSLRDALKSRL